MTYEKQTLDVTYSLLAFAWPDDLFEKVDPFKKLPKGKGCCAAVLRCWGWQMDVEVLTSSNEASWSRLADVALGHDVVEIQWWINWMCGMQWQLQESLKQFLNDA